MWSLGGHREECTVRPDISTSIGSPISRHCSAHNLQEHILNIRQDSRLTAAPPAMVPNSPGTGPSSALFAGRFSRDTGMTFLTV
jgi:hypothetical protein